jgi:hypothetical protein
MAGFYGSGDMYFRLINPLTNTAGSWTQKIYTTSFAPQVTGNLEQLLSRGRDDFRTPIGAVGVKEPETLNFTLNGGDREMFRLAWLASVATVTQASGNVTDEAHTILADGRIKTVGSDISTVVITNAAATTTYVANTDYRVTNARLGFIDVIAGSSLATAVAAAGAGGLAVLVDYARAAVTSTELAGGISPSISGEILFDGLNQESQNPFTVRIPRAVITPSSGFDLLQEGFAEAQFTASLIKLANETAPFYGRWTSGF